MDAEQEERKDQSQSHIGSRKRSTAKQYAVEDQALDAIAKEVDEQMSSFVIAMRKNVSIDVPAFQHRARMHRPTESINRRAPVAYPGRFGVPHETGFGIRLRVGVMAQNGIVEIREVSGGGRGGAAWDSLGVSEIGEDKVRSVASRVRCGEQEELVFGRGEGEGGSILSLSPISNLWEEGRWDTEGRGNRFSGSGALPGSPLVDGRGSPETPGCTPRRPPGVRPRGCEDAPRRRGTPQLVRGVADEGAGGDGGGPQTDLRTGSAPCAQDRTADVAGRPGTPPRGIGSRRDRSPVVPSLHLRALESGQKRGNRIRLVRPESLPFVLDPVLSLAKTRMGD
ncbi:unnamed protein product [Darwinula stevensoni]|uniref:Uncharacterized protein n=1 Tax=Darwinula stevensoni TaxID=69355 RepID=A0A7R9A6E1_9CRUS|nr:unnamed protein product [Darwinula stevensoni]CAG0888895.1 unnamed protein product [Darwinula stevensoni]